MGKRKLFDWIENMNDWLDEIPLGEKIKTLDSGKLVQCLKCKKIFFDRETPAERFLRKCVSVRSVHDCVEFENYTVLRSTFLGIMWVVNYPDSISPKDAIIDFFKTKKIRRIS